MNNDSIGIDISKPSGRAPLSDGAAARFANSAAGLRKLAAWMSAQAFARVVHEPTGPYHAAFERQFSGQCRS